MNFEKSNELRKRAKRLIPGGAHTYSKGDDQFSQLSPHSIVRGKGARIWDVDGNEFVDWGMGLTSVLLGHAYEPVLEVIKKELDNGCNFIRPSYLEADLAEMMVNLIDSAEMVKFGKNGSNATTAAVKLSRAYTGRDVVLRADQPFFSIDDWFIGDTVVSSGIPKILSDLTRHCRYNDLEGMKRAFAEFGKDVACVILEPAATEEPAPGYLQGIADLCKSYGAVFILDEVVSGFRFHPKGAQHLYKVKPDLSCWGKGMANGFSISAITGKREIMELGGIDHDKERVFLLSTTYGGETHHLRAAMKSIELMTANNNEVSTHIWSVGKRMREGFNAIARDNGIDRFARVEGIDCRPYFVFLDEKGSPDQVLRTLFVQEMIKHGVLVQAMNPSFSHRESEIDQTLSAFKGSLKTLRDAIEQKKVREWLVGDPIRPVFRKYNHR